MKNFLRIFIYIWVSIALLNVGLGILFVGMNGGLKTSDFPPLYISIPLLSALILNLILVGKIRSINKQDSGTRQKTIIQIITVVILEIVLGAYSFYLQTFGEELIILILITAILASSNLIYLKLSES